jgi:hypothetical protein
MIATMILVCGVLFLAAFLGYSVVRMTSWWLEDFVFSPPEPPAAPRDWSALERGQLPSASAAEIERSKAHLSRSCEVHGQCIPRTSHYGLIGQPLQLDE